MMKINQLNSVAKKLTVMALLMLPVTVTQAVIPEPDNLLFGTVSLDGQQLTAANTGVKLVLEYDGNEIGNYTMGDFIAARNQYVLEVPVDSVKERRTSALRVGDTLAIRFRQGTSSILAATFDVAERGSTYEMDLVLVSEDFIIGSDPDSPDSDGDGISDVYEVANGLNPLSSDDASLDFDGDGVSNLQEYLNGTDINVDDNPPHLIVPSDKTVSSTGLFTDVDLGVATAFDYKDGTLTATTNDTGPFAPGEHIVEWTVSDLSGNTVTKTQLVRVIPQVNFHQDQYVAEANVVTITAELNGLALNYPVTVPFTVSGTASVQNGDHDLIDGEIEIVGGLVGRVSFNVIDDGIADEGIETIVVNMGIPFNAVTGDKNIYTAQVVEGNIAPTVSLSSVQDAETRNIIVITGSAVTISANIADPNPGDVHTYDWTQTDSALTDTDGDTADSNFVIDPSTLTAGTYTVSLTVTDTASATGNTAIILQVLDTLPELISVDSDGDGVYDDQEGLSDTDQNGIPDYLDALSQSNLLQVDTGITDHYLLEAEFGMTLALGYAAINSGSIDPLVSTDEINAVYNLSLSSANFPSGLFEFRITGLSAPGDAASIVLPLTSAIPSGASYKQLSISTSAEWVGFVEDTNNALYSAPGVEGYCPSPGDSRYTPGLTEGNWCIMLEIEDGGPNDADGIANQQIASLSGLQVSTDSGGGGGGIFGPLSLVIIVLLAGFTHRKRRLAVHR